MAAAPFLPPDTETPAGPHCIAFRLLAVHAVLAVGLVVVLATADLSRLEVFAAAVVLWLNFVGVVRNLWHLMDHA